MLNRRQLLRNALAAAAAGLLAPGFAYGQQAMLSDQQLRAAFVLNFIRYTDWPERSFAAADSPLALCVLGGEASAASMSGIAGKLIRGHPLQVRTATTIEEVRACHVLFIPEPDSRRFVGTLRAIQSQPVLTISEAEGFIDAGGMIGLVHFDNRLQFEVNLGVVQQAQLKASSQLLRLARNIIEARPR